MILHSTNCLSVLKSKRNLKKDIEKVRQFSVMVDKKMESIMKQEHKKIENLSSTELQDLHEILRITDYILTKHESNKDFHSILKEFVGIISNSVNSVETLDDEISELVISAESTIGHIKHLQGRVSNDYDFKATRDETQSEELLNKLSPINLTKSSTGVYTQGYQHTSPVETEQVI
jgi:hypothetical protein